MHIKYSGQLFDSREIKAVVEVMKSERITGGEKTKEFEKKFANYIGGKFCITCNSGSSANLLAISALGLKKGSVVITPALTFPTTVTPIIQNGLIPCFVDSSPFTLTASVESIKRALANPAVRDNAKAIVIPHTMGNSCDMPEIMALASKHNLFVIEDCCDALGTTYHKKAVGTFGDIATFSFYPAHHITMGEGGAIVTSNPEIYDRILSLRNWGRECWCSGNRMTEKGACGNRFDYKLGDSFYDHRYVFNRLGYNLKITEMQAAIGLVQLSKLETILKKREERYGWLMEELKKIKMPISFPSPAKFSKPAWFGFVINYPTDSEERNCFVKFLESRGIETRLLFAGNITRQPMMEGIQYMQTELHDTDFIMDTSFFIGIHPSMTKPQVKYIGKTFREYFYPKPND